MLKNFEKLALRTKLIIGFTIVLILMVVISATSFWSISNLVNTTQKIYEKDLIGISVIRQINRDVNGIGRAANRYALAMNAGDLEGAKKAQEGIEKTKVDLAKTPETLVERAIITQYRLMIEKTIVGIKEGLATSNKAIKAENPVDFVVAGGTSMAKGFTDIFSESLKSAKLSIPVGEVIRPAEPLFSVAKGCLIAAEAAG